MHRQSFRDRQRVMGDWSEDAFRAWAKQNNIACEEWGLKRPQFKRFARLPKLVRHQPDFLCESPKDSNLIPHFFVEVKGVGKDQVVKVKAEDLACIETITDVYQLPVLLFVYDSSKEQVAMFDSQSLIEDDKSELVHGEFSDGNKLYYGIPCNHRWLSWEAVVS